MLVPNDAMWSADSFYELQWPERLEPYRRLIDQRFGFLLVEHDQSL
jgi:hypothetical protein